MTESRVEAKAIEGAEAAQPKVHAWLSKYVADPDTEEGCRVFLFRDASAGEVAVTHYTHHLDDSVEELVDEILNDAESNAEKYRGKQKYTLKIKDKKTTVTFSLKVISEMSDEEEFEEFEEELPTARGIVHQAMRHAEVFAKQVHTMTNTVVNHVQDTNKELREENMRLRRENQEMRTFYEEAKSMEFARRMEIAKFERSEARKEQGMAVLAQVAPVLAKQLLSGGGSSNAGAMMMQLYEFFHSLTDQQKAAIFTNLSPEQQAKLMEIHEFAVKQKKAEDAGPSIPGIGNIPGFGGSPGNGPSQARDPFPGSGPSQAGPPASPYTPPNGQPFNPFGFGGR